MSQDAQSAAGQNLPWVEKYRPEGLQDVIAHEDIISTGIASFIVRQGDYSPQLRLVSRLIDENQLPHLLFYGPPGTGKTVRLVTNLFRFKPSLNSFHRVPPWPVPKKCLVHNTVA